MVHHPRNPEEESKGGQTSPGGNNHEEPSITEENSIETQTGEGGSKTMESHGGQSPSIVSDVSDSSHSEHSFRKKDSVTPKKTKKLTPLILPAAAIDGSTSVWDQLRLTLEAHRGETPDKDLLSPAELSRLTPYSAVEYLLGCGHPRGIGWKGLFFQDRSGNNLGLDVPKFIANYGLGLSDQRVRDASLDAAVANARRQMVTATDTAEITKLFPSMAIGPKFNYRDFMRHLERATQACKVNPSPLRLLAVAAAFPSRFTEVIRDELIRDSALGSDLCKFGVWKKVYDQLKQAESLADSTKRTDLIVTSSELLLSWYTSCSCLLQKALLPAHEFFTRPEKFTTTLRKWVDSDKYVPRRFWDESAQMERRLFNRLTTEHKVTIDWSCRRTLLIDMVKSAPRFATHQDSATLNLSSRLFLQELKKSPNEESFYDKLLQTSQDLGHKSLDDFLQITPGKSSSSNDGHRHKRPYPGASSGPSNKRLRDLPPPGTSFFKSSASSVSSSTPKDIKQSSSHSQVSKTTSLVPKGSLRQALGISEEESDRRWKNKLCTLCGSSSHRAKDCTDTKVRDLIQQRNTQAKRSTESQYPTTVSSSSVIAGVLGSEWEKLLIRQVDIRDTENQGDSWHTLRTGLDTMCSFSLVSAQVVSAHNLPRIPAPHIQLDTVHSNEPTFIKQCYTKELVHLTLRPSWNKSITLPIEAYVVDYLPSRLDLLLSYSDIRQLGVVVNLMNDNKSIIQPFYLRGKLEESLESQLAKVDQLLVHNTLKPFNLPGASSYTGVLRRIRPEESCDTPEQQYCWEVSWPQDATSKPSHSSSKRQKPASREDYSSKKLAELSSQQAESFRKEINMYLDKKWWYSSNTSVSPVPPVIDAPSIITFPLAQGAWKSTKVRPCSDARNLNRCLPPASYNGLTIQQIAMAARLRWKSYYKGIFLDLSKAFYRCHLSYSLPLTTLGNRYYSDRVVFGVSFGPAALCGQIALLVSIALSALVGQDITLKDTRSLHEVCKDLHIFCYYDDFLIFGLPELVDRFVSIIQYTATRIGATFPPEKQDVLTPTQWFRHLGVEWGLLPDGCLGIRCVPPPSPEPLEATLSKRHAFAIAGAFYDPLTLHADARLCADYIRSFAGKAPGNTPKDWDTKWPLTKTQQLNLRDIIGIASKAMQPHQAHSSLPSEITHVSIIINCDASSTGYGWTTSLSDASKETNSPILWETYAKAFKTNEANSWHVNRKEMYCLSQSLAQLREWLDLIPVDLTVKTIIVNTDNTSALTWSQQKPVKMRSFDSTAILRMINGLRESSDELDERGISLVLQHVQGALNEQADKLSRLSSTLPPLGILGGEVAHASAKKSSNKQTRNPDTAVVSGISDVLWLGGPTALPPLRDPPEVNQVVLLTRTQAYDTVEPKDGPSLLSTCATNEDTLLGVADMTREDMINHLHRYWSSPCPDEATIYGVPSKDLYAMLSHDTSHHYLGSKQQAETLAAGGVHGLIFTIDDGLLLHHTTSSDGSPATAIVVPTKKGKAWIQWTYHDSPLTGIHRSAAATIAQAKEEGWWWPTMAKDIEALIETCHCQVARRIRLKGQPLSRRRVKDRFATVQMDFIGPISGNPANPAIDNLPPGGWKYFLVIIDEGTHCSMTIPAQDTSAQSCIIGSLIWFGAYGPPDRIHSDSGNGLASSEFQKFLQAWNIEQEFGSPETPRHQGLVEQLNGALKQVMKSNNSNEYPIPWYLSILCANIARQSVPLRHALGLTPSELALGASHSALLRGADLLAEQRLKQDSVDTNAPKNKATDDSHNNEQLTVWGLTNVVTHNLYCLYTLLRNERLDSEDVQDLFNLSKKGLNLPLYRHGDKVKLITQSLGKRKVAGVYEIDHPHERNRFLYFLKGKDKPIPQSALLPYAQSSAREILDKATEAWRVLRCSVHSLDATR